MQEEGEFPLDRVDVEAMRPDDYVLLSTTQDRNGAKRWKLANDIRKRKDLGIKDRILLYLRHNVGEEVTGEELKYVARKGSEWARRVRELRTEEGWSISTRFSGRPDLAAGIYVLEDERQLPAHDRYISDSTRRQVLRRDSYQCQDCGWTYEEWNPSDPRHLELHHIEHHADGGSNTEGNLVTLCHVCHDVRHQLDG
ncbi:HNH endonuclease [Lujinxingia sediminis]|uniref:HNH endonuclease n=1 Tax=Lujinxingia sediminis TaxID=2480984 RepID=UPI0019D2BD20|nr:HNH endonuclease [Lujinxingia sediminis]